MAQPNLKSLTTVVADSVTGYPTTSETTLVSAVPTGHTYAFDAIGVANITDTSSGQITLSIYKAFNAGSPVSIIRICRKKNVSAKNNINALAGNKPLYLNEGDYITMQANTNSVMEIVAPYVDYS